MTNGAEVAARLRKGKRGGIPWMVILDGDGKELITSDGPKGNVGCPVAPHEIAYFMEMIQKTATNLDAKEQKSLHALLEAYAKTLRRR